MLDNNERGLVVLFAIGCLVSVGKALAVAERVPWRVVLGRTIVGGTTAMIASLALAWWPDLPSHALYALASLCGHIGAESLVKVAGDWLARRGPGSQGGSQS